MSRCVSAYRLRQRLEQYQPVQHADAWTDAIWRSHQIAREAADTLAACLHWRITCVPADGCLREYFLRGHLDHVERRSALIFGSSTRVVAIEPAERFDIERIDRRLSLGEATS